MRPAPLAAVRRPKARSRCKRRESKPKLPSSSDWKQFPQFRTGNHRVRISIMKKLRLACILILAFSPSISFGGVRHFTFLYEAPTSARGSLELENWVTWQRVTDPDRSDEVDFRHELEYGVTDKFQVSVYLADWFYEADREHSRFAYSDSAIELIYNLTNPVDDPIGISIYGE